MSTGGDGDWSTAIANWDDGVSHVPWPAPGGSNDANFGGVAGTVTLATPITVNDMVFATDGYVVTGNETNILSFNGTTPTITVNTGTTSISAVLNGSINATVNKAGTGTLTLDGPLANVYGGTTKVVAGTLQLNKPSGVNATGTGDLLINPSSSAATGTSTVRLLASNQIGDGSSVTVITSGTLAVGVFDLNNFTETINNLTLTTSSDAGVSVLTGDTGVLKVSGDITLNSNRNGTGNARQVIISGSGTRTTAAPNTGILDLTGGLRTFNVSTTNASNVNNDALVESVIQNGGVIKVGNTRLVFTGDNTYTLGTTITTGTLALGNGGITGSILGKIVNNAVLEVNRSTDITLDGLISGTGLITKLAAGTLTLSAANTYSGPTTIAGGAVSTGATGTLANGGLASAIGKSSAAAANLLLLNGTLQFAGTGLGASTNRLFTIGNTSSGTTGTIDASGAATLKFTNAGAIAFGNANLTRNFVLTGTSTAANSFKPIIKNNGTGVVTLTKSGAGTWVLGGVNSYTGATTVNAGILRAGVIGAFGLNSAVNLLDVAGATLDLGGFATQIASLNGGGSSGGNVVLGIGKLTVGNSNSTTYGGIISGSGSVVKIGTGILTLTGGSNFTGPTTISTGSVILSGAAGAINASSGVTIAGGATLKLNNVTGANNTDRLKDTGSVTMRGGTLNFSNDAGATDFSETTGALSIATGPNTISVSQAATGHTAKLTFASLTHTVGTVNFSGAGLGLDSRNVIKITGQAAGNLPGWALLNNDFTAYDSTLGLGAAIYTNIAHIGSKILTGRTTDVRINSAGTTGTTITLGSATTTINALQQAFSSAATVDTALKTLQTTAIMIGSGAQALTIGKAKIPGQPTMDPGKLTAATVNGQLSLINNSGNSLTINAVIADNAGPSPLVVLGTGNLFLAGTNTFTGGTTLAGGIATALSSSAFGTGRITINGGTRLVLSGGVTLANDILLGPNTGSAGTGVITGSSSSPTRITGDITITNNAAGGGHFNGGANLILSGVIRSTVQVVQRVNTVTYAGGGTGYVGLGLNGTAYVGATNGIATTALVDLSNLGTIPSILDLKGFNQTLAGLQRSRDAISATVTNTGAARTLTLNVPTVAAFGTTTNGNAIVTGALSLVKSGVGIQTLSGAGANNYTGTTSVKTGVLQLQKDAGVDSIGAGNSVTVGTGTTGTLRLGNSEQINDAITALTLKNRSTFDLGAFTESVNPAVVMDNATISGSGAGGSGTTFLLARGGYVATGTNTISKSLSTRMADVRSGRFNIVSGTTTVSGAIQNDDATAGGLSKVGAGTLKLTGASTYTGATKVDGGTLSVSGSLAATSVMIGASATGGIVDFSGAVPSLGSGSTITVNRTGTLQFSGTSGDRVADTAALNLNGGAFKFTLGGSTETIGEFSLSASSTMAFTGTGDTLFAGYTLGGHTAGKLSITRFDSADHLIFTGNMADFQADFAQSDVLFAGFRSGYEAIQYSLTQFEIAPIATLTFGRTTASVMRAEYVSVPEPGSLALLGTAGLLLGLRRRRR